MYFKVDSDIFLKYNSDNRTCEVISRNALQQLADKLTKELPQKPTDKELLEWARRNYPGLDNIDEGQKRLDEVNSELAELDKV